MGMASLFASMYNTCLALPMMHILYFFQRCNSCVCNDPFCFSHCNSYIQ